MAMLPSDVSAYFWDGFSIFTNLGYNAPATTARATRQSAGPDNWVAYDPKPRSLRAPSSCLTSDKASSSGSALKPRCAHQSRSARFRAQPRCDLCAKQPVSRVQHRVDGVEGTVKL